MKPNKKTRKWLIPLIASAAVIAVAAVLILKLPMGSGSVVPVFTLDDIGITEYWSDTRESDGTVKADRIQTVYLSDTQEITEIAVKEGDTVKKGDVLLSYDTALTTLSLDKKRLEAEKLKLQLQEAWGELQKIRGMVPANPVQPEEPTEDTGSPLTEPYQLISDQAADGSDVEKAVICWIRGDLALNEDVFAALLDTPEAQDDPLPAAPLPDREGYFVLKVTEGDMSKGGTLIWQGIHVSRVNEKYAFRLFDASGIPDPSIPEEEPNTTPDSGYTAAEIAQMSREQEKVIRELEFQVKMAEADYKIAEAEASDGKVYAQFDGAVVSLITPEEARNSAQPLMKVTGGGGYYVEGTIGEFDRDTVEIGQEVTVNNWETGTAVTGTIQSVGNTPVENAYGYYGEGNPNVTQYSFTVFVDGNEDLMENGYVSISFAPAASPDNGVYVENAFLRTEQGKSFVFALGGDGKLEKRYVRTGKSLYGYYTQVLSGITQSDCLAFPYGKHVVEGASAEIGDLSTLYGG